MIAINHIQQLLTDLMGYDEIKLIDVKLVNGHWAKCYVCYLPDESRPSEIFTQAEAERMVNKSWVAESVKDSECLQR